MSSIEEKRVYADRTGGTDLYVASELGVTRVTVSGEQVGEFALARRCTARDVAAGDGRLAVATDEDVLVADGESFAEAGFGPAVAVAVTGAGYVAAGPEGRVARHRDGQWVDLGTVPDPRALDGDLLAAGDGVYRLGEEVVHAGLEDVRDVSAAGRPLAATAEGLYYLGNGWMDALSGSFTLVESDGDLAHAATDEGLFERRDGAWTERPLPVETPVTGVAHGEYTYAVTRDGTVLVDGDREWRTRAVGLSGVTGLAVVR